MASIDSDILANLLNDQSAMQRNNMSNVLDTNTSIAALSKNIKDIHDYLLRGSASSVASALKDEKENRVMQDRYKSSQGFSRSKDDRDYGRSVSEGFSKDIKEALSKSNVGQSFVKSLTDAANAIGADIKDDDSLGKAKGKIGKAFADMATQTFSSLLKGDNKGLADVSMKLGKGVKGIQNASLDLSKMGQSVSQVGSQLKDMGGFAGKAGGIVNKAGGALSNMSKTLYTSAGDMSQGAGAITAVLKKGGSLTEALSAGGPMIASGIKNIALALGPKALVIVAAIYAIHKFTEALQPAIEGVGEYIKALKSAATRDAASAKENAKLAKERLNKDINTLVEEPFNRLKAASDSVTSAFDNTLRVISASQGYTKSDVQNLMSAYAERLRSQGLTDIVAGSDLITNLSKVIEAGLSGKVAEEFAYQATILGNAIPTQDFFGYASTYSSIAANAIRLGKSEEAAISEANASLSEFANNLLYASRELAGGYSTGLKNAQTLYEQSVKIAQAGRSSNIQGISGVMTSVAAIVGATAPDLANAITDAVYSAATGGNSGSIVALRSLAGINASNTEFLRALAENPQSVFASLFNNLANMFNDSTDAYMEKAAGYAELFGLSSEAFQRIDFNYLAQAISDMNLNSTALNENMELMVSGETTLTAEQLKNREINKYMLENGLSYVLDNESARAIQQHMWDEQIARDMMEAQYGVNLQGAALEALTGIATTVKNILTFLNPIRALMKLTDMIGSWAEGEGMKADIQQVLMRGNVGEQNEAILKKYITRNANLNLTTSLVSELGGVSMYESASSGRKFARRVLGSAAGLPSGLSNLSSSSFLSNTTNDSISAALWNSIGSSKVSSGYNWNVVGKSANKSIASMLTQSIGNVFGAFQGAAQTTPGSRVANILGDLIKNSDSLEDLAKVAKSKGITNLSEALDEAGFNESDVAGYYETKQTQQAALEAEKYRGIEREFYAMGLQFFQKSFPEEFQAPLFETLEKQRDLTDSLLENFVDYFINHTYYDKALGGEKYYKQVLKVQAEEKSQKGDAVYALAEALTANTNDLRDPTLQTNAILSQILVVVNAIMQQNNTTGSASGLAETLAALAMGGTYNT